MAGRPNSSAATGSILASRAWTTATGTCAPNCRIRCPSWVSVGQQAAVWAVVTPRPACQTPDADGQSIVGSAPAHRRRPFERPWRPALLSRCAQTASVLAWSVALTAATGSGRRRRRQPGTGAERRRPAIALRSSGRFDLAPGAGSLGAIPARRSPKRCIDRVFRRFVQSAEPERGGV